MEDSFRVRVDKTFGSLLSSSRSSASAAPQPSPSLNSLWSLTDDEIEPRPWRRDTEEDPEPKRNVDSDFFESFPSGFTEKSPVDYKMELEKDLEDLAGDDVAGEASGSRASSSKLDKPDDFDGDEWEVKSSIGMDPALDNEEEEDEYDKVAIGKEKAGDRLYMKDINDYETDADLYDQLPCSFTDAPRDPRANLIAAKIRLKEDAEAAKKLDAEAARKIESLQVYEKEKPAIIDAKINSLEEKSHPDSVMKRKETMSDSKSQKRVRFDTEQRSKSDEPAGVSKDLSMDEALENSADACSIEGEGTESLMEACSAGGADNIQVISSENVARKFSTEAYSSKETEEIPMAADDHPTEVPDYLRNPSKYRHYTFDSSNDLDEASNRQAYMDFLNLLKNRRNLDLLPDDSNNDFPNSIVFIPRRKPGVGTEEANVINLNQTQDNASREAAYSKSFPICVAAMDAGKDECGMEVDEQETVDDIKTSSQRHGRHYRLKPRLESYEYDS